ncbi:hypothetical protein C5Y82_01095 [Bacillus pumilus]|nr:hypothetical protein C5Y82_01095 [Bacillus pumilus]
MFVQQLSYNYSARTKRSDERCLVDEDGGYRNFGGCLPADQKEITAVSVSLKQRGDSLYKGNTHDLPN